MKLPIPDVMCWNFHKLTAEDKAAMLACLKVAQSSLTKVEGCKNARMRYPDGLQDLYVCNAVKHSEHPSDVIELCVSWIESQIYPCFTYTVWAMRKQPVSDITEQSVIQAARHEWLAAMISYLEVQNEVANS